MQIDPIRSSTTGPFPDEYLTLFFPVISRDQGGLFPCESQ
jgi:hypothetical protein